MSTKLVFLGLDVDEKAFHCCFVLPSGETIQARVKPQLEALLKKISELKIERSTIHCCYEAGYLGFQLCRDLQKAGVQCFVIAPGLIPQSPGKQVKNDRLDAIKLATLLSKGMLTPVHVPTFEQEQVRDLLRTRAFLIEQTKAVKVHLLSLCRRAGLSYRQQCGENAASYWTDRHMRWLYQILKELPSGALKSNMELLLMHLQQEVELRKIYEERIHVLSQTKEYKPSVDALVVYRGLSIFSAMTLVAEIHDIHRFVHPKKLTSFCGLDIREYSSGGRQLQYGITKMGNTHLRRVLVEACQTTYNKVPKKSYYRDKRCEGKDPQLVAIADRAAKRIYKRSTHLLFAGKHPNKVKVAAARELIGFIWESLRSVQPGVQAA